MSRLKRMCMLPQVQAQLKCTVPKFNLPEITLNPLLNPDSMIASKFMTGMKFMKFWLNARATHLIISDGEWFAWLAA